MKRIGLFGLSLVLGLVFSASADSALVDFERKWIFPQELGGLKYEISEKYEVADFGYRIIYRAGEVFEAEINVYDLGQESIPNGHKGEGIDIVLQSVEDDLQLRKNHGEIENLKKLQTTETPKTGTFRFATVVSCYEDMAGESPEKKIQATYVTGIRNRFIRLRFTFDREKRGEAGKMANKMIAQLTKMATARPEEEEILLASCAAFLNDPASYGGLTSAQHLFAKTKTMGNLNVYTHLFVWPTGYYSKPKNADLLIAGYFAGMLQVVVPQKLDEGGEVEAFSAMLDTYKILRSKEQIDAIEKIDEWAKHPDRRALFDQLLIVE
ncbi:MAG: hypothetical protein DRP64_06655 [Verrucomicrobia bacterium]|nr:MAG: hypothetical protein DRP64_06655 [Verrucomicrobiota bacterium]